MRLTRAFSAALAALFAAGCSGGDGGGGGGNGGDPPVADAGDDAEGRLYRSHALDGSQSADPEGKDLSFTWGVISAPDGSAVTLTSSGAAAQVSFTPDREGTYIFGLVVSDGKKLSTLDVVEVSVELRVAVFGDRGGEVAREIELAGGGEVDDFYAWPDTYVAAATGEIAVLLDTRDRRDTLIAYHSNGGTQELLASADDIESAVAGGDYVVWLEERDGQYDLFSRNLVTGEELRITNDDDYEILTFATAEFAVFFQDNPPYAFDVFLYDLSSHGLTNVSEMNPEDDVYPYTDGDTIVFTSQEATLDAFAFDVDSQDLTPIASSTSAQEIALGVSGDFVALAINTMGAASTLYLYDLSTSGLTPIEEGYIGFRVMQGDYMVYRDQSDNTQAYRLSTGTTTLIGTGSISDLSLLDGVVAFTEYNGSTYDVKRKILPAGAVTVISTGEDASSVELLSSGIMWDSHPGSYVYDAYFSADGGTTVDLASDGKVFLADQLDEYDVVILGGDIDSSFAEETYATLSAAGVPILSFDRAGPSLLAYFSGQAAYGLDYVTEDCNEISVRFANASHPAFTGFAPGGYSPLDRDDIDASYETRALTIDDLAPPTGFVPLATYDVGSSCPYEGEVAIGLFTNSDGTPVLLDAAATDDIVFWNTARLELLLSEIRYLASTRAP